MAEHLTTSNSLYRSEALAERAGLGVQYAVSSGLQRTRGYAIRTAGWTEFSLSISDIRSIDKGEVNLYHPPLLGKLKNHIIE